jgi:hypothetical protein
MAQKGNDSRKSNVTAGEQVRRNGTGLHKNSDGRKGKVKRKESIIVPLMKKRWSFCKIAVGKEWHRQTQATRQKLPFQSTGGHKRSR